MGRRDGPGVRDQPLEPGGVDPVAGHVEPVAGVLGDQAPVAEREAEAGDVGEDAPAGAVGRVVGPHRLDQPVDRHHLARGRHQHAEEAALLRAAEGELLTLPPSLDGAEHPHLERHAASLADAAFRRWGAAAERVRTAGRLPFGGVDEVLVDNGDITLRVEVTGTGPTVLCVPGWPELASSWRHQVDHLAGSGHRVAALDVRGYGGSSAPSAVERYTLCELAGDVAAVAATLDDGPVVLLGHDWGAPIVWRTALLHPDRVRAVAGLSVPHLPPTRHLDDRRCSTPSTPTASSTCCTSRNRASPRPSSPPTCGALSSAASSPSPATRPLGSWLPTAPRDVGVPPTAPGPAGWAAVLPARRGARPAGGDFERTGMAGAFNRYRAAALDAADEGDLIGAQVAQPSCFIGGELDPVRWMIPGADLYADPGAGCTDFRGTTLVPDAGHWVHQEAVAATNTALDAFLQSL